MNVILSINRIYELLRTVDDPEIGINIVDLGFIYEVISQPGRIRISMALTTSSCPMRETILAWTTDALRAETDQEIEIDTDSAPAWTPDRINREALAEGE